MLLNIKENFKALFYHSLNRIKMKYIDFESWTITWLHEGNVIVEDQLTHSGSRTAPPKAVFCRSAKCEQKLTMILF